MDYRYKTYSYSTISCHKGGIYIYILDYRYKTYLECR